jgi:hypothetical protein
MYMYVCGVIFLFIIVEVNTCIPHKYTLQHNLLFYFPTHLLLLVYTNNSYCQNTQYITPWELLSYRLCDKF